MTVARCCPFNLTLSTRIDSEAWRTQRSRFGTYRLAVAPSKRFTSYKGTVYPVFKKDKSPNYLSRTDRTDRLGEPWFVGKRPGVSSGGVFLGGRVQCPEHATRMKYYNFSDIIEAPRQDWSIECEKGEFQQLLYCN